MKGPMVAPAPPVYRINVTPIIDVALVLVIILLITAPMMSVADMDVTLPDAHTRDVREADKVLVTLDRQGEVAIQEDIVGKDQFRAELSARLKTMDADDAVVVIRADRSLHHGLVSKIVDEAKEAGARRIAIATSPKVVDSK